MSVLGVLLLAYARWARRRCQRPVPGGASLATVWRMPGVRSALR
jgi:hypothetical protein